MNKTGRTGLPGELEEIGNLAELKDITLDIRYDSVFKMLIPTSE